MIISIIGAWQTAKQPHLRYMQDLAERALESSDARLSSSSFLRQLLSNDIETLAIGSPSELRQIITAVGGAFAGPCPQGSYQTFLSECRRVLNYERFRDARGSSWGAYKLCEKAGSSMCPYCQLEETRTVFREGEESGIRPELDHYYNQSNFPYLSLSLYNLVPSCGHCNSMLKRDKNFFAVPHLHPFEDNEVIKITIDLDSYLGIMNTPTAAAKFSLIGLHNDDPQLGKSIGASQLTFMLNERYENEAATLRSFLDRLLMIRRGDSTLRKAISSHSLDEAIFMDFECDDYKSIRLGSAKRSLWELVPHGP